VNLLANAAQYRAKSTTVVLEVSVEAAEVIVS
jgi:hypothetical protein